MQRTTEDIAGVGVGRETMHQVSVRETLESWLEEERQKRSSRWHSCAPETQFRNVLLREGERVVVR